MGLKPELTCLYNARESEACDFFFGGAPCCKVYEGGGENMGSSHALCSVYLPPSATCQLKLKKHSIPLGNDIFMKFWCLGP